MPLVYQLPEHTPKKSGEGKVPVGLLLDFPDALEALARHMQVGADKYGRGDWINHDPSYHWSTYLEAMQRHLLRFAGGEDYDDEGHAHAAALAAGGMMLFTMWLRHHPGDNRPAVFDRNEPGP